ncbi:addiction module antidote protein [Pseudomonas weihenstephanensis]|uniref:addiction module antidote protein n=1 Tax=Pseudomonas weihenstephanensis TaxID=1608994 RepID=UPI00193AF182|nr:addiction module antidote protein [Pseudomonas weihenstephanensis]MBM1191994.1 putative addiction module antidote protein [Pseudomonas weihenstephanensis]
MTEQLTRFDTVDYLKSREEMAAYLDACFEQDPGDGSLIRAALNDIARAQGMSQLSRDTGLGRESLYKALGSSGNPEFATVIKVMKALGLKLHASAA